MNRQVALKVLPAGIAADTKAVARFVREAQVAGKLGHPNVVSVYGMGVEAKTPYYSMEYVEGETLAQILGRLKDAGPAVDFFRSSWKWSTPPIEWLPNCRRGTERESGRTTRARRRSPSRGSTGWRMSTAGIEIKEGSQHWNFTCVGVHCTLRGLTRFRGRSPGGPRAD